MKIHYALLLLLCNLHCIQVYPAARTTAVIPRHRESCCDRVNKLLPGLAVLAGIIGVLYQGSQPLPCLPPATDMTSSCWKQHYRETDNSFPTYKGPFCPINDKPLTVADITNSRQAELMAHYVPLDCIAKAPCPDKCKKKR